MQNQLLRGLVFIVLVFVVTSDVKELVTLISSKSSTLSPFLEWLNPNLKTDESHEHPRKVSSNRIGNNEAHHMYRKDSTDSKQRRLSKENDEILPSSFSAMKITDDEKKQLMELKQHLTQVMQQWCLPKLVCELHASITERGSLTDAERGLLSLIRETSLGSMGEVVSRYHFAAHMGQLLSGVEGNGCHNLYPNCPLSGNKVLQMVKKVRIR